MIILIFIVNLCLSSCHNHEERQTKSTTMVTENTKQISRLSFDEWKKSVTGIVKTEKLLEDYDKTNLLVSISGITELEFKTLRKESGKYSANKTLREFYIFFNTEGEVVWTSLSYFLVVGDSVVRVVLEIDIGERKLHKVIHLPLSVSDNFKVVPISEYRNDIVIITKRIDGEIISELGHLSKALSQVLW